MKYQRLQIFRPTLSTWVTQGWGENRACVRENGTIYGAPAGTTCPKSYYQSVGMKGHNGVDIGGLTGTDIYHAATFPGWWHTEVDLRGGIGVDITSNEPLFFPGPVPVGLKKTAVVHVQDGITGFLHYVKMRYWHLHTPVGHTRKQVTCGTVIGLMGNTGVSSGTHLHFAPKWCTADGKAVWNDNGYYGAFDPTPYYNPDVLSLDHSKLVTKEAVPLTREEMKDIIAKLTLVQKLLITLQKLKHNI